MLSVSPEAYNFFSLLLTITELGAGTVNSLTYEYTIRFSKSFT